MMDSLLRVAVVGAGVIGAAVAGRLAKDGAAVTLIGPEPDATGTAAWVAAGMLAPLTEGWPGEEALLELGSRSLARWPDFAAELATAGADPGLRTEGTLAVAVDDADGAELDILAKHLATLGRAVDRLTGRDVRALEPGLGRVIRSGLSVPGDLAVDNRRLVAALFGYAAGHGVQRRVVPAEAVRPGAVELAGGPIVPADVVVLAAGAWSAGLHVGLRGVVRPVKGEILRLRARAGSLPPPGRTVRGLIEGRHLYLVPRDDGGLVVGATTYEAGFDAGARVGGVRELLIDAERLLPAVDDYVLEEVGVGYRPGTADNLPVVRWLEPGVLAATGHGRNGFLLLPDTVARVAALVAAGQ